MISKTTNTSQVTRYISSQSKFQRINQYLQFIIWV